MNISQSEKLTCILFLCILSSKHIMCWEMHSLAKNNDIMENYQSFFDNLESVVYKYKKKTPNNDERRRLYEYLHTYPSSYPPPPSPDSIKTKYMLNSQKGVLSDVLMMKLVSFYENKFKIADKDITTPEVVTKRVIIATSVDAVNEVDQEVFDL